MLLAILTTAATAWAQDPDTLRSETTAGLFRDPLDYLGEPALLSLTDGTWLYTGLADQESTAGLALGAIGPVGLGRSGFQFQVARRHAALESAEATTVDTWLSERQIAASNTASLRLGTSTVPAGGVAFGAGLAGSFSTSDASLQLSPWGTPVVIGPVSEQTTDGEVTWRSEGTYRYRKADGELTLGFGSGDGGGYWGLDVLVGGRRATEQIAGVQEDAGVDTYSVKGRFPGAGLDGNHAIWRSGVQGDSLLPLGTATALRLSGRATFARGEAVAWSFLETQYTGDEDLRRAERLQDSSMHETDATGLAALHLDGDTLASRLGLRVSWYRDTQAYNLVVVDDLDPGKVTWAHEDLLESLTVSLPLAVEVATSERFTLRLASSVTWYTSASTDSAIPGKNPGGSSSAVRDEGMLGWAAVGLRYRPVERLLVDCATTRGASYRYVVSEQSIDYWPFSSTFGLHTFYLSGVFLLP